jgi:hypothetical protein
MGGCRWRPGHVLWGSFHLVHQHSGTYTNGTLFLPTSSHTDHIVSIYQLYAAMKMEIADFDANSGNIRASKVSIKLWWSFRTQRSVQYCQAMFPHVLIHHSQEHQAFRKKLAPLISDRKTQLVQEFSFWPSSPPKELGGIYEMRMYSLVCAVLVSLHT